ncbi:hypothetical protein LINPERHAP2_LOCUS4505 [Linum perenne]
MGRRQLEPPSMPYNMDGERHAKIDQLIKRSVDDVAPKEIQGLENAFLEQPTVDMEQTNGMMSMGATLFPSFPTVGPNEATGSFLVVGPNGLAEAIDSFPIIEPSGSGNGVVDSSNIFSFSLI